MSQVRESLNPGLLEGDLQSGSREHVQSAEDGFSADNGSVGYGRRERGRHLNKDELLEQSKGDGEEAMGGDYEEEGHAGGGHDSDPPIENQNPEDGDGVFEEVKEFVEDEESGEGENENANRKKVQFHHRKRKKSVQHSDGSYVPPYKKNRFRRQVSVLPSKFLLGGNIRDPLNLASLADAKVNAELNKATPKSSPLPVPSNRQGQVPVFIPKNPGDPLGLSGSTENPSDIIAGVRVGKHKKHRQRRRQGRKRTDSECSVGTDVGDDDKDGTDSTELECKQNNFPRQRNASFEKIGNTETSETRTLEGPTPSGVPKMQDEIKTSSQLVLETTDIVIKCDEGSAVVSRNESKPDTTTKIQSQETISDVVSHKSEKEKDLVSFKVTTTGNEVVDTKDSKSTNGCSGESGNYPCKSSEYVPLSSSYAPSPFIYDTLNPEENFEVQPFESPSLTNYCCNAVTPSHLMEPFSPPPRPEIPHFQKRMQMMSNPHRHHAMSLQRAVFQKPCYYRRRFRHKSDPIVSPVIPQPGCSGRRNHHHHHHNHRHNKKGNEKQGHLNTSNSSTNSNQSTSKKGKHSYVCKNENEIKNFRPKDEIYQFGNYKQYYGYRTTPDGEDARLWLFKKLWFEDKDVLDIGCNIGHVTLSIARDCGARRVHGIDIDNNLITTARKNIKHYMIHDPSDKNVVFPHSLPMIYGAMQPPSRVGTAPQQFPFNVMFSQENYVLSNDALLETVKPEYDVIICLSVTKWIHLNFGDDGLKRFFLRMYKHLRPDGKLILEPQEWTSYYRKRKLTAKISDNYKNIRFLPAEFQNFLTNEVGFKFVQRLGTPHHSKGFQRPIYIFSKESTGELPNSSGPSDTGEGNVAAAENQQ